jgi:pimeloyl-ACP methyl ester carboxylesterase
VALLAGLAVTGRVVAAESAPEKTLALADGVSMAYVDSGRGEPALVFVHCGNCRKEIWRETLDAFAPKHRVVAMDLPGHGRSGATRKEWSVPGLGADVAALADHLGLKDMILVGNSLGGPVSLEAAKRLGPKRVRGVVAVDTLQDVEQVWPEDAFKKLAEAYRQDFRGTCQKHMSSLLPQSSPAAVKERVALETCHNDPDAFRGLLATLRTYDAAAALRAAGVPVRAINAKLFPTNLEVNRKHAPSFEAVLMDDVGHYPQVERPAEFQAHLRRIVQELAARR